MRQKQKVVDKVLGDQVKNSRYFSGFFDAQKRRLHAKIISVFPDVDFKTVNMFSFSSPIYLFAQ